MDIQDNYVTIPDGDFPNNRLWNPQADPNQLDKLKPFLPTPADTVGIGIATLTDALDPTVAAKGIPVRLSTFTTKEVSVDYTIGTGNTQVSEGTLHFIPGETVQFIPFALPSAGKAISVSITLGNPINAELTGHQQITCQPAK